MKWFERIANKRRPDYRSASGLAWKVFDLWRFHIVLMVKTHTVSESGTCEIGSLAYTLQGQYIEHRLDGEKDEGDYEYHDSEGRWVAHDVRAREFRAWSPGEKQRIELFPAVKMEDKLLDMPEWMKANDVEFNTDKQVWLLLFGWYK